MSTVFLPSFSGFCGLSVVSSAVVALILAVSIRRLQARITWSENCSFKEQCRSGFIQFRQAATLSVLVFSRLTAGVGFVCRRHCLSMLIPWLSET